MTAPTNNPLEKKFVGCNKWCALHLSMRNREEVRLSDQRVYDAQVVGASPRHDLAVLKINIPRDAPPPLPLGSSHDLQVGQKVFAIGNPFGLDHTLTTGIISALGRSIDNDAGGTIDDLIQSIDGREVNDVEAITDILDAYNIGDQVTLEIYRDGKMQKIEVLLGAQ